MSRFELPARLRRWSISLVPSLFAKIAMGVLAIGHLPLGHLPSARADILGFSSVGAGAGEFTANSNGTAPTINAGALQITPNAGNNASSAFYNTKQDITNWTATFTYTLGAASFPPADGFAFVIHNDPRGLTALGANGGASGYSGGGAIQTSAAPIFVNIYNGGGDINTVSQVGIGRLGGTLDFVSSAPVNFRNNTPINVTLTYNQGILTQSFTDGTNTFATRTLNRNLQGYVGASTAYVGFTGGTGGATAQQTITNFQFTTGTAPAAPVAGPIIAGMPQGGAGYFGIREVTNNNNVTTIAEAENSILNNITGTRRVVDYTASYIDIFDSDGTGDFSNNNPYASAASPGPGVGNVENLAMISTGTIRVVNAGFYTFAVRSDDGFRLSIAGNRFETTAGQGGTAITANGSLEFATGRGAGERSYGHIYLAAGDHAIQLLNWEGGGGASVELSSAFGTKTEFDSSFNLVGGPAQQIVRRAGTISGAGWEVVQFNGAATLAQAVTKYEQYRAGNLTPDFTATGVSKIFYADPQNAGSNRSGQSDFGSTSAFLNNTGGDDDNFSTGARAQLTIGTAGRYTFNVQADDSIRLRFTDSLGNDVDIVATRGEGGPSAVNTDGDGANDALQTSGCCGGGAYGVWDLATGTYTVELIHQEGGGGSSLALFGAFGDFSNFDPAIFQLLGQNIDGFAVRPAGLELVATPVPEPSTFALLGLAGVVSGGVLLRRRQRG